jgi:hypothetical protein
MIPAAIRRRTGVALIAMDGVMMGATLVRKVVSPQVVAGFGPRPRRVLATPVGAVCLCGGRELGGGLVGLGLWQLIGGATAKAQDN